MIARDRVFTFLVLLFWHNNQERLLFYMMHDGQMQSNVLYM